MSRQGAGGRFGVHFVTCGPPGTGSKLGFGDQAAVVARTQTAHQVCAVVISDPSYTAVGKQKIGDQTVETGKAAEPTD